MGLRESTEIQGNILAPFKKPNQVFLFVNFGNDQKAARAWLSDLAKRVATTQAVVDHTADYKAWREARDRQLEAQKLEGQEPPPEKPQPEAEWIGVGLTSWGLVTLHPELAPDLVAFDAFWRGPLAEGTDEHGNRTAPPAILGSEKQSDPGTWVVGGPNQPPVDAVVTIAADDEKRLRDKVRKELELWKLAAGRELTMAEPRQPGGADLPGQWGATIRSKHGGIEHFGFKDGVSQPGVRGFTDEVVRDGRLESQDMPGSPIIATGEFLLGYPGERGSYLRGRRPDPPEWMWDGSFQVFLRLTQDVAGWHKEMEELEGTLKEDVAAKVIGRRQDGRPLARRRSNGPNDFDYGGDLLGNDTPRFAHIRRLNPRNDAVYNDRSHRLLRRGIPFGPFANDREEAEAEQVDRGLLLNAFMASIDDQFEVVMRSWASNSNLLPVTSGRGWPENAITDGPDPLIGASTHPCVLRRQGQAPVPLHLRRFVWTSGAVYAFAPSISTLIQLGENNPMRQDFPAAASERA